MSLRWLLALLMLGILINGVRSEHCHRRTRPKATERLLKYGSINYRHSILTSSETSKSELVQRLFDLGFVLAAGYNQPEARRAFRQALEYDSMCAMCWWGVAYARGPFQNKFVRKAPHGDPPMVDLSPYFTFEDAYLATNAMTYAAALVGLVPYGTAAEETMRSIREQLAAKPLAQAESALMRKLPRCNATLLSAGPSSSPLKPAAAPPPPASLDRERYYIAAMFDRFSATDRSGAANLTETIRLWKIAEQRFVRDMIEISSCFPDDATAPALAAEALANLSPWMFVVNGTVAEDKPRNITKTIISLLQESLRRNPSQPLALHLMIHVTEELPARMPDNSTDYAAGMGLDSANRLLNMFPTLDHMQHMPSHTYVRLGRWDEAIESNRLAFQASFNASQSCLSPLYPDHNVAMLVFAASLAANYEAAQVYARVLRVVSRFVPDVTLVAGLHWPAPILVYVLFGNWTQVILEPLPPHATLPHPIDDAALQSLAERVRKTLGALVSEGANATAVPNGTSDVFDDPALDPAIRNRVTELTPLYYMQQPDKGPHFVAAVWLYAQLMAVADKQSRMGRYRRRQSSPPPSSPPLPLAQQTDAAASSLSDQAAQSMNVSGAGGGGIDPNTTLITKEKEEEEAENKLIDDMEQLLKDLHSSLESAVGMVPPDTAPSGYGHGDEGGDEGESVPGHGSKGAGRGPGPGLGVLTPGYKLMAEVMLKMANARIASLSATSSPEQWKSAIEELRHAAELEDSGGYTEPPRLAQQPVRQCLGWVYIQAGMYTEAVQVYDDDLARYPNNPWSVMGLSFANQKLKDKALTSPDSDEVDARARVPELLGNVTAGTHAIAARLRSSCPAFGENSGWSL